VEFGLLEFEMVMNLK